jgi:hypothetical protein
VHKARFPYSTGDFFRFVESSTREIANINGGYLKMEASGLNQWKIGDVRIIRVVESEGPRDGTFILPNGTAENVQKESDWL